jgi:HTH-type transcriptional regulator / antitoxin HipB
MMLFDKYLNEQLKDPKFREYYEEEKELLQLAYKLNEERIKQGKSQGEAANGAHLTQQQFSRVENGENCNIITYLKACRAVGLKVVATPVEAQNEKQTYGKVGETRANYGQTGKIVPRRARHLKNKSEL